MLVRRKGGDFFKGILRRAAISGGDLVPGVISAARVWLLLILDRC